MLFNIIFLLKKWTLVKFSLLIYSTFNNDRVDQSAVQKLNKYIKQVTI